MEKVYVFFYRGYANRGVDGWVSLYFLCTQLEKTVRFNGRPLSIFSLCISFAVPTEQGCHILSFSSNYDGLYISLVSLVEIALCLHP